jgi:uncharacterized integral membrane protein
MTGTGSAPTKARRRVTARQVGFLVILGVTALFIVQNRDWIQVHLFTFTLSAPVWLMFVMMVALGVGLGVLLHRRRPPT